MEGNTVITNKEVIFLPVNWVRPNPYQPRRFFDRAKMEELAQSIREYGVMQPISVRLINNSHYELVSGERRLRAAAMAGLLDIPAIVVNIGDQDSAMLAIIENLQRQDLNFLEEAEGYQNLLSDYTLTQEQLASRIGKSQSSIANKMRILKLSKEIQKLILRHELTERHARALLAVSEEETQISVIEKIVSDKLTVKQTEDLIERINKGASSKRPTPGRAGGVKRYVRDIRLFTNTVKQAVDVMNRSGVAADYLVTHLDDGCEINIKITY